MLNSAGKRVRTVRYTVAPLWMLGDLTGAAESLLPQAKQQALADVTVGWLVKMLHPPAMLSIPLCHLQ